jgi:phage recombination protein Bet
MTQAITSGGYTLEQLNLITRTVAQGATKDELTMFLHVAKKSKLDPFLRQIHFVKRAGKATIQVGIDGYRAIADRTNQYAGNSEPVYEYTPENFLKKATVTVYRFVNNQKCEFTGSALWDEYCPQKGQDFMWQKMPHVMLAKVAETIALRKAFPNDLAGLYTQEEMAQSNQTIEETAAQFKQEETIGETSDIEPEPQEELPVIEVKSEVIEAEESPFAKAVKKTSGAHLVH